MRRRRTWTAVAGLLLLAGGGCKKPSTEPEVKVPEASHGPGAVQIIHNPGAGSGAKIGLRVDTQQRLQQVGKAYLLTAATEKVSGPEALGPGMQLTNPAREPFVIVWNVDPNRLPPGGSQALLAWESKPDTAGGRHALLADCNTVVYLTQEEFDKAPRATPGP